MILDLLLGKYGKIRAWIVRIGLGLSALGLLCIFLSIRYGWKEMAESLPVQFALFFNLSLFVAQIVNSVHRLKHSAPERPLSRSEKEPERLPFPFMLSTGLDPETDTSYSARLEAGVTESELLNLLKKYQQQDLSAAEWQLILQAPAVKASRAARLLCLEAKRRAKNKAQIRALNPPLSIHKSPKNRDVRQNVPQSAPPPAKR